MQEAVPEGEGTMAALVGLADEEVEELCRQYAGSGVVAPANFNCPGQIVISGDSDAVERVSKAAQGKEGCKTIPLNVSAPFHSPLMVPAGKRLREVLETAEGRELDFDVISNFTADAYPSHDAIPELLTQQVSNPVRWHGCMETVMSRGINLAIELGPKRVLVGLMKRISREMSTVQMEDKKGLKEVLRILNF
jgi:[acyl-carrier-protein] S-malonyltransferase